MSSQSHLQYLTLHVSYGSSSLTGASSLVSILAKLFAEHKRNEVQDFVYDDAIQELEAFETAESCLEFLGNSTSIQNIQDNNPQNETTLDNFVQTR